MQDKKNYVTKEGYKKIEDELYQLKKVKLKEIAARIQDAKELGDLSENAEYIEAKNEQSAVATKILELEQLLKNTEIITHRKNTSNVEIGSKVKVRTTEGIENNFTIVGSSEADPVQHRISNQSPIGEALLGKSVGDRVEVQTPGGTTSMEILSIE